MTVAQHSAIDDDAISLWSFTIARLDIYFITLFTYLCLRHLAPKSVFEAYSAGTSEVKWFKHKCG